MKYIYDRFHVIYKNLLNTVLTAIFSLLDPVSLFWFLVIYSLSSFASLCDAEHCDSCAMGLLNVTCGLQNGWYTIICGVLMILVSIFCMT